MRTRFKWLSDGGEMSDVILFKDWSATPLGPLELWPASLRTTVSLCLASNFPINIIWGPEAIQIYNAGYRVVCGAAHPRAIGESYRVTWASAWPAIGEPFERARRGETSFLENQRMFLERNGYLEETFFTFSLSPIRDEFGEVVGLFHPVTETTAAMLGARRTRALRDLVTRVGNAESTEQAGELIAQTLDHYHCDVAFAKLYRYQPDTDQVQLLGRTDRPGASDVGDTVAIDSAHWPFRDVLNTGTATLVEDVLERVGAIACSDYAEPTSRAFIVPIKTTSLAAPFGFAVVGLSTRLPLDPEYVRFIEMLGEAIGNAIGAALSHQAEKQTAADLAALDKAKTTFFSNVSHEFRTPLTLMLGPLEDSLSDAEEPLLPRQRQRQELVNRNALRLLKLVNTLLEFSRIEAGRVDAAYRPTDLPQLTRDLASVFRAAIEKAGLVFKVEIEDLGEPVFVDHDMWEKIVLNLLSNAFKFTFDGEIEIRLERRGHFACLIVRDTGTGIPPEEMPKLFQRFHQIEGAHGRTYEGSGIGLALISELVKLHGGTIDASSQQGTGSAFEIAIPLGSSHLPADRLRPDVGRSGVSPMRLAFTEEASGWLPDPVPVTFTHQSGEPRALGPSARLSAPAARVARQRIVIAEDNADMRSYLKGLLDPLGDVEAMQDGQDALEYIQRSKPDLIVSDVMMPRLDGLGLLARLRSDPGTAGIPFVLLSARAGEESRIAGLRLGADDFLEKPFSARELVARATTQLKLSEARRLAETERNRLYEFFMQAQIPMVILQGPEHRYFLANEAFETLVGMKVVGKTVGELFESQVTDVFIPLLDQVYATGRPYMGKEAPLRIFDKNGEAQDGFIDFSFQPFRESSGEITGLLSIVLDVTEQVRSRATIEEVVVQLTVERELRERFVLTLMHDLRSPLGVLHMVGVILQKKVPDPPALKLLARRIVTNAEHADGMIRNLLDANSLKAGQRMPLAVNQGSLHQLVETAAQGLTELYGERFRLSSEAGALPGLWDSKSIRRVVENLAGNAVKYGKPDGPVTLSLRSVKGWVELAVHNEGDAIAQEEQTAIFEPFHRTRSATSGTQPGWGVGLTLVKGIAQAYGGSVSVVSNATDGTTFVVRFPLEGKAAF